MDISAASEMNLYHPNKDNSCTIGEICQELIIKYPSLHSNDKNFEEAVSDAIHHLI
jgi:hypothetical protein